MPEGRRINLEEGLTDSPQVRAEVSKLEKYLPPLKEYSTLLRDTFQACSIHQEKVCEGTDALSKLLTSFQSETMGDQETFIPKAFFRLSRFLSELHSCQEMLSTQLQNAVIELLSQFINTDFGNLEKLKENFEAASQEHEQATSKFSRISKKKDSEKVRFEANADLFASRKKFYESALDYHSELNCFQHKKKFAVMEPLLTFMHAQMAYFKVGHEILSRELGSLLTNLNTEVQRVHEDYQKELVMSAQTRADIELRFPTLCLPDPDPTDPFTDQPLVPNTSLTTKAGYLCIRTQTGFPSKWDRMYFFTKKGYLYIHVPPKAPELIINLKGAEAVATESDDRRYVFMISHSSLKRPIYLLAESDLQKEEWISTINNIGYDRGHAQPRSNAKRDEAVIKLEREKIRSWVNKEIDPKKDKSLIPKIPKTSPTPTPSTSNSQLSSFPSLPSFLNFLDPSAQSSQSDSTTSSSTSIKKSPIFSRRASATPKLPEQPVAMVEPTPQPPPSLPSPLQPERLTAGGVATNRQQQQQQQQQPQQQRQLRFSKTFFVKYLGHMEVPEGRNISVITDTIQKVMTARVVRNVKDAQCIEMTVTNRSICLYDHNAKKAIGQIVLRDILRCAVQPDSVKLFGIVNRTTADNNKNRFICHVMEANTMGSQVCSAINEAIQAAVRLIQLSKHERSKSGSVTISSHKDQVSFSANSSMSGQTPPTSSSMSGQTPPTSSSIVTLSGKSLSKALPKQKSVSDSSLFPTMGKDFPRSAHSTSVTSTSSHSSVNSLEDLLPLPDDDLPPLPDDLPPLPDDLPPLSGYLPHTGLQPSPTPFQPSSTPLQPSPAPFQPSFVTMPPLIEQQATAHSGMGGGGGGGTITTTQVSTAMRNTGTFHASTNVSSGDRVSKAPSTAPIPLASAATSSDYYQMPSSLLNQGQGQNQGQDQGQDQGQGQGGDTTASPDTFSEGEMDSPLPPLDMFVNSSSSSEQQLNGFGGAAPPLNLAGDSATSANVDSGYFQMPGSLSSNVVNYSADTSSNGPPASHFGSGLPDSGSTSSYLLSTAPGSTSDGAGASLFGDTPLGGSELSSSDHIFNVSSSSTSQDGAMFPLMGAGDADASSTNSGYLPAPTPPGSTLEMPTHQVPMNNVSSSGFGGSFPGMAAPVSSGGEGDDLDDFDLPPLPDSMDQPGQVGVAGYVDRGATGYGGSLVTMTAPRTQQN